MRDSTYHGEVDIRFIVKKATNPSDVLVVAFPGAVGLMTGPNQIGYNNLMTIGRFNVNALFIRYAQEEKKLGYGKSRFTCIKRDFKIERTVVSLIDKVKAETGSSRVIAIGTSMGAWCSLYFGLKYGYDIISGAPGYKFGRKDVITRYMAGGVTEEDGDWCDNLLRNVVADAGKRGFDKSVFIAWGRGEKYYTSKDHGQLLLADLNAAGIEHTYRLYDYQDHKTISLMFPNILAPRLEICLGLKKEEAVDVPVEMRVNARVKDQIAGLKRHFDHLGLVEPNLAINARVQYGSNDAKRLARNYSAAQRGSFFLGSLKTPMQSEGKGAAAFWSALPVEKLGYGLSYLFQQSVLNHYKASGDVSALKWVGQDIQYVLTVLRHLPALTNLVTPDASKVARNAFKHRTFATQRLHCLLDYQCCVAESTTGDVYDDNDAIRDEIVRCLRIICTPNLLVHESKANYERVNTLLHAAIYFRNSLKFHVAAYKTALSLANELTDYYFDSNGVCRLQQARMQHILYIGLKKIMSFIDANAFDETPDLKKMRRKYISIHNATSFLVAPDGVYPALGHSDRVSAGSVARILGNFIKPSSNLAVLGNDFSYITINSGTNINAAIRHCDLLSFQFFYDGEWLILDSGGGSGNVLADFAQSSVAHSALLCDERDYVTPVYSDWTSIDSFEEHEDYVRVSMSHRLFDGVTLSRTLLWLKPNVIMLCDQAVSDDLHFYSQNFILPSAGVENEDQAVTAMIGAVKLGIRQFSDGSEFSRYDGTTDVNASAELLRGSLIRGFKRLEQGINLVYAKKTANAMFLTALEARSGRPDEIGVSDARVDGENLVVTLEDGRTMSIVWSVPEEAHF